MGYASGSVTFQKLFMVGQHPDELTDDLLTALEHNAFGHYNRSSSDDLEFGWIVPNHLFDVDFSSAQRIQVGRFLFVALRCDRTAPPASLVKSYEQMEMQVALEASGRDALRKDERAQAKEAARDRAAKEARQGLFRRMAAYPLLIDFEAGVVYFGNLGSTATDSLLTLFSDTFGCSLVQAGVEESAFRIASQQKLERAFDTIQPALLVKSPDGVEASGESWTDQDKKYLGREFLTWLWYRSEVSEGLFELGDLGAVIVAIDKTLSLRCCFDLTGTTTVHTDVPSSSPEARAALRLGKMPQRMGVVFSGAQGDWTCTLHGETLAVSGLSLTRTDDTDPAYILEERFSQIRTVSTVLERLLKAFVDQRLSKDWADTQQSMSRWVQQSADHGTQSPVRLATA